MVSPDTMIMAQEIGGGGFEDVVTQFGDWIKGAGTLVIAVVAIMLLLFIVIPKAMSAFGKKRMGEGLMHVAMGGAIVLLAIVGVSGLFSLVDAMNPVENSGGNTDLLQ